MRKKYYIGIILSLIPLILLDQVTKLLADIHLKNQKAIPIIKDVLVLDYVENRGAAFGTFQGGFVFFVFTFIVLAVFMCFFAMRVPLTQRMKPLRILLVFVLAGAIGNFIDRIRLRYVIDFIYFKLIDFPVFNVADIYVTVSMILLIILCLFYYKEEDFEQLLHRKG